MDLRYRIVNIMVFICLFVIASAAIPFTLNFQENPIRFIGVFLGLALASWFVTKLLLYKRGN